MRFHVKVYRVQSEVLVAVCDEGVYGRSYREGELVLKAEKKFFGETTVDKEELLKMLRQATIVNFVGKEAVACGVRLGLIDPQRVLTVQGVPHAQMVRM
jgi:hypothetical protein